MTSVSALSSSSSYIPRGLPRCGVRVSASSSSGSPSTPEPAQPRKMPALSFRQQQRSVEARARDAVKAVKQGILDSAPVVAILQAVYIVVDSIRPHFMFLLNKWDVFYDKYCEFCSEEVKRAWRFKRQHEPEEHFWVQAIRYLNLLAVTLLWECSVPVSFLWAVALPMYLNWIMFDEFWKPWQSPITAALLLVAPFKFTPWAAMVWI